MKKLTKLLVFVCSLMLLVGSIFAIASMAANEDLEVAIPDAKRTHIDFTGIVYDRMKNDNGANAASPKIEIGAYHPITEMVLGKYGHLRTVKSPLDDNTWYEWLFEFDNTAGTTRHDSVLFIESQLDVGNISYYIQEFDMTTRTNFPGNMQILFDARAYNGATEAFRHRLSLAQYNSADKSWHTGDSSFTLEAGEWAHITIVTKIVKEYKTVDGVTTKNYGKSVANLYVNGQYMHSEPLMANMDLNADATVRIQYMGIGYSWGTEHTGTQADDSIVLDNVVKTTIPSVYAVEEENDELAPLFYTENPTTDLTDISVAVVWNSDYNLPDTEVGVATYIPEEGEEYIAANIEQALQMIKNDKNDEAFIKLYANRYKSVHIDYPCTIDLNGFSLLNGYTTSSDLLVTRNEENGTITFAYDATKSATFKYYDAPYASLDTANLIKTQIIVAGNSFTPTLVATDLIPVIVDGKIGYGPTGEFEIYDENGNKVTITQITDAEKGKTYTVCPAVQTTTCENDIVFYHSKEDGGVVFYDTTDLLAAKADKEYIDAGTLVLLKDATFSAPIKTGANSTLKIDLGGNALVANISVSEYSSTYKGMSIFFYSTKEGAKIDTQGKALLNVGVDGVDSQMGHSWYFGHIDPSTQSPCRLEIRCMTSVGYVRKGCAQNIYLANSDIYVKNGSNTYGVFGVQLGRAPHNFQLWNCNLFTSAALFSSGGGTATSTITLIDSKIYGTVTGRNAFGYTACAGETTIVMQNSKIYNMGLGGDKNGTWTGKIQIDNKSKLSFLPNAENTIGIPGYTFVAKEESTVIDGVTYVTTYQLVSEDTKHATFHIYGVTIDKLTEDTPILDTQKVLVGSWFSATTTPEGESFYDPATDLYHVLAPAGYAVYDENGNLVNKNVVDESDAGATYYVCIYLDKVPVCFYQKLEDGTYVPSTSNKIGSLAIPEGATIVLLQDCVFTSEITLNNNKLDLNGNTLYTSTKGPDIRFSETGSSFIYSSKAGAEINALNSVQKGAHLFVFNSGADAYLGYVDENTPSPYPITISSDSFTQADVQDVNFHLQGINIVGNGIDNYGMFCARFATAHNINFYFENCKIVVENRGILVCSRGGAYDFNVFFKNTEIFFNLDSARPVFGWYDEAPGAKASVTFENCGVYGNFQFNELTRGTGVCTVTVKGDCKFTNFSDAIVVENGYRVTNTNGSYSFDGLTVPQNGMYGNPDAIYGNKTYSYAFVSAFDANAYRAQAFQNMTLDTNVVGNLYIPVDDAVLAVMLNGVDILDKNAIRTIGEKDYYVLTFDVAPKYGNKTCTLTVQLRGDKSVVFPMSVGNYAKALFALNGENNEYVADSQRMMKYVLTYIKEVAVRFGGANADGIFQGMDIAVDLDSVVIEEESKDTSAINTYVTHAALNLDAYAGYAFKVAQNFVGTIRVEMAGVDTIEKVYTVDAPAGENEVIVLENVPAYLFRGDVTITVTPREGDVVSAQCNLATYVRVQNETYAKAFYAYTVEAEAYNTKYPTLGTVN